MEELEERTLLSYVTAASVPVGFRFGHGSNPVAVATGDFNHDGKIDIVTADQGTDDVSLLLGNGNGTFQLARNFPLGVVPNALIAVDLNNDGNLDVVTANQNGTVSVLLGNGNGTFRLSAIMKISGINVHVPPQYAAGSTPLALAAGDLSGDGIVDLAVANGSAGTVTLLFGNGAGQFSPGGTVSVGPNAQSVAIADFNHDHHMDLATVGNVGASGQLTINLNNGGGTFAAAVGYGTGFCPDTVAVGDFNHDGNPDLAVGCVFPSSGVDIHLGNADGTFQPATFYRFGGRRPVTLVVADLTGTGVQDIISANGQFADNTVAVMMGNGDGTFGTVNLFTAGEGPVGVAVGDFNGDGIPDVVSADKGTPVGSGGPIGTATVMLGNGDGTLLAAPDLDVTGPGNLVTGDFTGDGITDIAVVTTLYTSSLLTGVMVFPGLGNGSFATPIFTQITNAPLSPSIAVGDFNGDHVLDLACTTNNSVTILLGNGDGSFTTGQTYAAGTAPTWIAVDDFNGDGHSDLAVADNPSSGTSGGGVSILLGNGDGTFSPAISVAAGGAASYVATGDLNRDGIKDLAVVNGGANTVTVLTGVGNGNFAIAGTYHTQVGPASVGVGDFTGDHWPDLMVPTFFGNGAASNVTLFRNMRNGKFFPLPPLGTHSRPIGITVGDFNNDHRLDFAVADNFADDVVVFPGNGNGTFGAVPIYTVGDFPTWITNADFNGDGYADLAVVGSNSGTVTLLETGLSQAARFRVTIAPTATAGNSFQVTVAAVDADNRLMPTYTGTVSFSSSDGRATLPSAYRFTLADHGIHRFTVTLRTAGSESVSVRSGSATGTGSISVVPTTATHLKLTASPGATAGTPFDVTVTALDPFGNVAPSYLGTVHFTSNDPSKSIVLPSDYTFTATDNGVHTFVGMTTLVTAGTRTVTTTDLAHKTVTGTVTVPLQAAVASQLLISGPTSATAGSADSVTVTAKDPYGNIATGFTGTAHFTSSDGGAQLPADYPFAATDNGKHVFQVVFQTAGPESLTVSSAGCSDGQQNSIVVKPGPAAQAAFVGQPSNTFIAAPMPPTTTVQVEDAFDNPVGAGVKVTVSLAYNPSGATLSGASAVTNANGLATLTGLALSKPDQGYTLMAHAGPGTSSPSATFTVYSTTHFGLSLSTSNPVQAGTSFTVTVTALDASNHPDLSYVGTVHFSSTASPLASLPADYTFQPTDNGQATFNVTLNRAGVQTLTVADLSRTSVKGTASVTITAGALNGFQIVGIPLNAVHNTTYTFTVTAVDQYGNTETGYLGAIQFSNAGGTVVLVPGTSYQFTAADQGRHTCKITFQTTGANQSVTVTDANDSSDTDTLSGITVS